MEPIAAGRFAPVSRTFALRGTVAALMGIGLLTSVSVRAQDASISYKITENLTATLDGSNLLDQEYHDYHGTPLLPRDVRRYDRVVGFALRWKH